MRKQFLRLLAIFFLVPVGCWCGLFLYVNINGKQNHLAAFRLPPLFERFTLQSDADRAKLAPFWLRETFLLFAQNDPINLVSSDNVNGSELASNCSAYKAARFFDFPDCSTKISWMKTLWNSNPCYAAHGVLADSYCSILDYLSLSERACPPPAGASVFSFTTGKMTSEVTKKTGEPLKLLDFETASRILKPPRSGRPTLAWITQRLRNNWVFWQQAVTQLCNRSSVTNENSTEALASSHHVDTSGVLLHVKRACGARRRRLRVHLHVGSLTKASGTQIAEMAGHGGPLGELVQWSDLLGGLLSLGHDVTITTELNDFTDYIHSLPDWNSPCQNGFFGLDLLYTDIGGLVQLRQHVLKGWLDKWKCVLRVLDTFGTEPLFNDYDMSISRSTSSPWGRWNMRVQQFFTMFPHTADNSFLGFVIASNDSSAEQIMQIERQLTANRDRSETSSLRLNTLPSFGMFNTSDSENDWKEPQSPNLNRLRREDMMALVYGKTLDIWQNQESYLRIFNEYLVLHATVSGDDSGNELPSYVINHGLVSSEMLSHLYRTATMFIGLGFPYEGPSPLEAISFGCVFVNVRFKQPLDRDNTAFFGDKPTNRKLTSQHPYMETYVGEPYVYTVDPFDEIEVRRVIERVITSPRPRPYVPYEFTPVGYLERLLVQQSTQFFCPMRNDYARTSLKNVLSLVRWPPASCVETYLGAPSISCNEVCVLHKRICEPNYFLLQNYAEVLANYGIQCVNVTRAQELGYPAVLLTSSTQLLHVRANNSASSDRFYGTKRSGTSARNRMYVNASCFLQTNDRLFSCAESITNMRRICPCRRYRTVRQQTVLC